MPSLLLAMKADPHQGEPLPSPFTSITRLGAVHRRGQVSICAGASGGGKSAYATHLAVHGEYNPWSPIPTLYCAADSDRVTLGTRVAAGILNRPLGEVEHLLRENDRESWELIASATEHISWNWETTPSLPDIGEEVDAFAHQFGDWPHLVVIDNLINVDAGGGEDDHRSKDFVVSELQKLAADTNAHVLILHHVTGAYESGDQPIPKAALLDKVAKRPRLVLTFWKPAENLIGVSVVKNSTGKASADGSFGCSIPWLPEVSWFGDGNA